MTHNDGHRPQPDTSLPQFSVNVTPTDGITAEHLSTLLARFRAGDIEPLILGDDNRPEAAVIPFSAFVRLMKQDHAAYVRDESAFQAELSRRVAASDDARARGEEPGVLIESDDDLVEWAKGIGEPFASMVEEGLLAHDESSERDDG